VINEKHKGGSMMQKRVVLFFLVVFLLTASSIAFAHGGEEGEVDAPTYVRQALAFLEGTNNVEAAKERVQDALKLESDEIDQEKLLKAQKALENSELEQATFLLVKALGKEPNTAEELSFKVGFKSTINDYLLIIVGVVFIIIGGLIIRKKGLPATGKKGGIIHG
jgi:hypothetical protein